MFKKKHVLFFLLLLTFCKPASKQNSEVRIRLPQDPESLNPVSYTGLYAQQVINLLFQSLLTVDLADGEWKPLLVEDMPQVSNQDSVSFFTYRIKDEAVWDNGTPVTAADVAFSVKVMKCPLANNEQLVTEYDMIRDVRPDTADARKFTIVCNGYAPEMAWLTGDFFILPSYIVDPRHLLKNISVSQLVTNFDSLSRHPDVVAFANHFNSATFSRDKNALRGSGGYVLDEWKTGQYLKLRKKENWWGEKLLPASSYITANPEKVNFQIIPDQSTASLSLRNGEIDVYDDIPATEFLQLQKDKNFTQKYTLATPNAYSFTFIGINSRLHQFADRRTRQAFAHLVNVDNIIKATQQGFATPTVGPITPANQKFYNASISPYSYNLKKAEKLLLEAGWQKRNGQWIKAVEETEIPLTVHIQYKAGNTTRENIALIFKQAAQQLGIPVEIQPVEGALLFNNMKSHQFEFFVGEITGNPFVFNFKPILHRESAGVEGFNFTGFGTVESDSLIDAINHTSDLSKKKQMLKRLQEILHEQATMLFLYANQNRIAVNNRFKNLKISGLKPGYDVTSFTVK